MTGGRGRGAGPGAMRWVSSLRRPIARAAGSVGSLSWRRGAPEPSCQDVAAALPLILEGGSEAASVTIAHVQGCLACQAELARYRKVVRLLHQLQATEIEPPPGVVAGVLSSLEAAASRHMIRSLLTGRRVAYGTAVLAAGGAATGLVALARTRSRVPGGLGSGVLAGGTVGPARTAGQA